jgi:hypothetical protein
MDVSSGMENLDSYPPISPIIVSALISVRTGPVWAGLAQFPIPAQGNQNTGPDRSAGIRPESSFAGLVHQMKPDQAVPAWS